MPGYAPCSISFLSSFPLGPPATSTKVWQPVEGREHLGEQCPWLDQPWPTDDSRGTVAAFPSFSLLPLEWRHAAVREGDRLCAVVGGEHDNGVVELAHVFQLFEDDADVVRPSALMPASLTPQSLPPFVPTMS